jgi:hypothetical protein
MHVPHPCFTRYIYLMCNTANASQSNSATTQKKSTSRPINERTRNVRSCSPIRNERRPTNTRTGNMTKKTNTSGESSCDGPSDISNDEAEQEQPPSKPSNVNERSPVHEFATKMSDNSYECSICSKVRMILFLYNSMWPLSNRHQKT